MPLHLALFVTLFGLWLLLSGHGEPWLVGLGLLCAGGVTALAARMSIADREHGLRVAVAGLRYWPWLLREIVKANIDVARRILDPRLPISPTMVRLPALQTTALGRVIYANSITLTPGTVTVGLQGATLEVHALSAEAAADLALGEMSRRVSAIEGPA